MQYFYGASEQLQKATANGSQWKRPQKGPGYTTIWGTTANFVRGADQALVAAPSLQTKIHLRVALLCQTAGDHKMHQNASNMQNSKDRYHYPKHHCVQWEPALRDHYVTFSLAQRSLCPVGTGVKRSLSHTLTIQEVIVSSGHLRSEITKYSLALRLHCDFEVTVGRSQWNRMRLQTEVQLQRKVGSFARRLRPSLLCRRILFNSRAVKLRFPGELFSSLLTLYAVAFSRCVTLRYGISASRRLVLAECVATKVFATH